MSNWKCEICGKEFENFQAQGFDNKVYCPLCFFKEKTNRLEKIRTQLKEENQQLKEVIEEVRKIIETAVPKNNGDYMMIHFDNWIRLEEILDKIKEVK